MSEPIISVSGLRGIVGASLTPIIAMRFACAFAREIPSGPIVITRDGRTTGRLLADAIRSGLTAIGRDVVDADIAATPTTGVLVRHYRAAGGIQISASHNPAEYNGIKLFSAAGNVISAADGEKVIEAYRKTEPLWAAHERVGQVTLCSHPDEAHLRLIQQVVDVGLIQGRNFHVLLDSNHGAGSDLGSMLLETLGCKVTVVGGEPDGKFDHLPEPTAENLQFLLPKVTAQGADIGFCQDPDADRLAIIDESGRYLGEEYTLALCVDHVLRLRKGPVVTNCSTSKMTEDIARKHKVAFFRSPVGEANVVEMMRKHEAILGGEGNGGVIDPRVGYVRDSFIGMALVLEAMARSEQKVSRLADELPRYEIVKTKIALDAKKISPALKKLERHFKSATADKMDGLRLDWDDKWLLIRPSNTEPIVRVIAEGPNAGEAERLCDEAAAVLAKS